MSRREIPTEPIGSIPPPLRLIQALATMNGTDPALDPLYDQAIRDTIERSAATGSPVITDGEQRKYHNLMVGNFYIALAGESDRGRVLEIIRDHLKPGQRILVGVVAPIDPRVETPEEVRDRTLLAAKYISVEQLGSTDDCGFSPFCDDTSTTRDTAFAKIRARVAGTALASEILGGA
jgi:methionine synthase II (cobalamin-independent)